MLTLAVYNRRDECVVRYTFARAPLADVAIAGRTFLDSPHVGDDLDRYVITDAASGAVIQGRDRRNRSAPPIARGDLVAYCVADADELVMIEGRVVAIGPAPHDPDGPPCYHVRVAGMIRDCRRTDLAAPIYAYPPTSTPPPGSPGGASIARLPAAPEPAPARLVVPA